MNPERFHRLEALYEAAASLDAAERSRFIEEHCAGDADLRRDLLTAFRDGASGLTDVVGQAAASATVCDDAWSGRRFGPYRVVRALGRGGMGAVFLAVRDDDEFHKEVAIKTLKFELESESAITRFRHERQILAHLEHPNIARVLDGGTTGQGTPYIVMEYVAGVPITEFCEARELSIEDRLRLFRLVCDAAQYVHQHLVVHRDIKPANLLVNADGVPKLLDFGIAKLLDANAADHADAAATATGALLMTPDFASPEQARGEAVSTVTDVYALGGVLYALLTGQRPHVIRGADPVEMIRAICDTDIRPPSTYGNRRLRGDLDTIVMRAMQKEPARRYASAAELSEDVRRHLTGLPIAAREDSAGYRAMKFVRRHRIGVAASAAVVISLAAGIGVSLHEARVAERRFDQVRELATTFLFQFYDQVTPLPGSTAVRASIVDTARKYLDGLAQEAAGDTNLTLEVAQAYHRLGTVQGGNLGQLDDARRSFQHALDLYATLPVTVSSPQDQRRRVADVWLALSSLEFKANHEPAAETATRHALDLLADRNPDPQTLMMRAAADVSLSDIQVQMGDAARAESLIESADRTLRDLQGSGFQDKNLAAQVTFTRGRLARARVSSGDLDGALKIYLDQIATHAPCAEDGPPSTACMSLADRLERAGDVYAAPDQPNLGEPEKAVPLYEQVVHIAERYAATDAQNRAARFQLAARSGKLGDALWRNDPRRALDLYDRALATAKTLASKEQLAILQGSYHVAVSRPLILLGRTAEARKALVQALEGSKTDASTPYPDRIGEIGVRGLYPSLLIAEGKSGDARTSLETLIHDIEPLRASHPEDLMPIFYLSDAYRLLASMSTGTARRNAYLQSAAAWHAWPATSFTQREEQKDLAAANK